MTLADLAKMVKAGEDFIVYDAKTNDDITRSVLTQIIFEQEGIEGQSLLPTVIAAFVTFADGAIYPFYENAPRIWGLTAESDQQIGGGVMKLMGSLILWGFIAWIFFDWYARDEKASKEPHLDDVNEELERLGLSGLSAPPRS